MLLPKIYSNLAFQSLANGEINNGSVEFKQTIAEVGHENNPLLQDAQRRFCGSVMSCFYTGRAIVGATGRADDRPPRVSTL